MNIKEFMFAGNMLNLKEMLESVNDSLDQVHKSLLRQLDDKHIDVRFEENQIIWFLTLKFLLEKLIAEGKIKIPTDDWKMELEKLKPLENYLGWR